MPESHIFDTIRMKRAVRSFNDEPLPEPVINMILDAGRRSGSAKNSQPWHFIAVTDQPVLNTLSKCGEYAGHLGGAAMAVALVTEAPFERDTVPFDLGRATQNMMLTAWSLGVGSVMATIYQADRAREVLKVPDGYMVPWCISFGYPADESVLERPPRSGGRRSPEEIIHWNQW